jgi:hypothetical protein
MCRTDGDGSLYHSCVLASKVYPPRRLALFYSNHFGGVVWDRPRVSGRFFWNETFMIVGQLVPCLISFAGREHQGANDGG